MQMMIQDMHLQYDASLHPTYQDYVGQGNYEGHNNYRGRWGHVTQRWGNWRGCHGAFASSDIAYYCSAHGMCDQQGNDCRTTAKGHKNNAVWCNKMSGSKRNCTWQVRFVPASNSHLIYYKTSFTFELLCISIVYPPKNATIIKKSDSDASNNY